MLQKNAVGQSNTTTQVAVYVDDPEGTWESLEHEMETCLELMSLDWPQIATLTAHEMRVLYLAMSPDGQTIVTGAGDETLRFWSVFPGPRQSLSSIDSGLSGMNLAHIR